MTSLNDIVTEFQLFYEVMHDIYVSNKSPIDKWADISAHMSDNNQKIISIFAAVKKQSIRKEIKLDYSLELDKLQVLIGKESDPVVKSSDIILAMHIIVYDLMSTSGNYYFTLDGPAEMQVLKKPLVYYINFYEKPADIISFHAFFMQYALESLFNNHFYIGIDYEYTVRKIQLGQFNFEHNVSLQSIIIMVRINNIISIVMNDFVELIICNKYIKKILHGADSLDIPYMYNHMLADDPEQIMRFTRTVIDTRFLCEYYKLTDDTVTDHRCSIYDEDPGRSAVYFFNLISEEKQQELSDLLDSMPAPHDIKWDLVKLPKSQLLYAQYDVIYLKYFYYRIIYLATEADDTSQGKKSTIDLYKHVLNELTRFVYLERNNITMLKKQCKTDVDVVNNYFIRNKNGILKMIDIFNNVSTGLQTYNPRVDIDKLALVNHFKDPIMTLVKRIVYGHISTKCKVQKDKSTIWTDKMSNQFIFDFLEVMGYEYLYKIFKELNGVLETRVKEICMG